MARPSDPLPPSYAIPTDPVFQQQLERLHRLTLYSKWLTVGALWLSVAPLSLWALRSDILLLRDYFTWTAVRYGLAYNPLAATGLTFCIVMTLSALISQSRPSLMGLSARQRSRLEKRLCQIREKGPSHPLWKWVCRGEQE